MKKTLLLLFTLVSIFGLKAQTLVTGQFDPVPVTVAPFEVNLFFTNSTTTITTIVTIDGMGYFNDTSSISGNNYTVTASFVDCQGNTVTYTANYIPPSAITTGHYDFGVIDWCQNAVPGSSTVVGQFNNTNGPINIYLSYDGGITYQSTSTSGNGVLNETQNYYASQSTVLAYYYDCNNDTIVLSATNISGSPANEYYDFGTIDYCPGSASGSLIQVSGQMSPNSGVIAYTIEVNNTTFSGMTDASGAVYIDSISVATLPSEIYISFLDCNGNLAIDTGYPSVTLPYPAPYEFGIINYCPNIVNPPVGCLAGFTVNQNVVIDSFGNIISTSNVFIGNNSQGQNLTYTWDFGDGSPTYTGVHFLHTYANAGPYVLCLTVSSPATPIMPACSDTYCDTVMVNTNGVLMGKTSSGFTIQMGDGSDITSGTTAINNVESSISNLSIYPNPAKESITISLDSKENNDAELTIYDLTGKLIQTNELNIEPGKSNFKIDLENINQGIYLVTIKTDKGFVTRKLSIR